MARVRRNEGVDNVDPAWSTPPDTAATPLRRPARFRLDIGAAAEVFEQIIEITSGEQAQPVSVAVVGAGLHQANAARWKIPAYAILKMPPFTSSCWPGMNATSTTGDHAGTLTSRRTALVNDVCAGRTRRASNRLQLATLMNGRCLKLALGHRFATAELRHS